MIGEVWVGLRNKLARVEDDTVWLFQLHDGCLCVSEKPENICNSLKNNMIQRGRFQKIGGGRC